MTAQVIPTGPDPSSTQTTTLDGVPYVLSFQWLQRGEYWTLSLATTDGELVAVGLKLVVEWDLLDANVSPLRPPGMLFVLSSTPDTSPPGLTDLTTTSALPTPGTGRCQLIYLPIADIEAQAAAAAAAAAGE